MLENLLLGNFKGKMTIENIRGANTGGGLQGGSFPLA